jgi:hypothetical protein
MNFAHFHQRDDLSAATCQSDSHTPKLSRHGLFISEAKAGNRDQRWPAARAGCATARFRDVIASGKSSGGSGGDSLGLPAPMLPQATTHSSSLTHRAGHPITQTALSATNGWQSSNHPSGGANTYCFGLGIGKRFLYWPPDVHNNLHSVTPPTFRSWRSDGHDAILADDTFCVDGLRTRTEGGAAPQLARFPRVALGHLISHTAPHW